MFYKLKRKQRATITRHRHTVSAVSKTKTDSNNTHKGEIMDSIIRSTEMRLKNIIDLFKRQLEYFAINLTGCMYFFHFLIFNLIYCFIIFFCLKIPAQQH